MRIDVCIGMCIGMCMDVCMHICIDMCVDMCIDMFMGVGIAMCRDMCANMCVSCGIRTYTHRHRCTYAPINVHTECRLTVFVDTSSIVQVLLTPRLHNPFRCRAFTTEMLMYD